MSESQGKIEELWTPPYDGRFHSQQNTKYCWQNLIDFLRCADLVVKSPETRDPKPCAYFYHSYLHLCPSFWREKFEEQLKAGSFPANVRGSK